jgi:hypothetical protein
VEEERGTGSLELYPNPASGQLTLDLGRVPEEACTLVIYDISGRPVYRGIVQEQYRVLDVSGWIPGLYLVRLESRGETEIRKLLR